VPVGVHVAKYQDDLGEGDNILSEGQGFLFMTSRQVRASRNESRQKMADSVDQRIMWKLQGVARNTSL